MAAHPDPGAVVPGGVLARRGAPFEVHLDAFTGPFDLLLGLIAKHRLDITEIALAEVTDEFVSHLHAVSDWDLSQASEFVLVAATLLDLKASRLLPHPDPDAEEDRDVIEARDLLFARLLQYRAFKQVASDFETQMASAGRVWHRDVGVEQRFASLLPELVMTVSPEQLARLAARALTPAPEPAIPMHHLHTPSVSVREQAELVLQRVRGAGGASLSFEDIVRDASSRAVVVARFLALLELFRDARIAFEQSGPLAPLELRAVELHDDPARPTVEANSEFDEEGPV
ncbi:MAG: ScpA family protein [Ornithinimicrobium sp.]